MKNKSKWLLDKIRKENIVFSDSTDLNYEESSFLIDFARIASKYSVKNNIPSYSLGEDVDYISSGCIAVKVEDMYISITSVVRKDNLVIYKSIPPTDHYAIFDDVIHDRESEKISEYKILKFKDMIEDYVIKYDIKKEDFLKTAELIFHNSLEMSV